MGKKELSMNEIKDRKYKENLCLAKLIHLSYNFFNIINLYSFLMIEPIDIKFELQYLTV